MAEETTANVGTNKDNAIGDISIDNLFSAGGTPPSQLAKDKEAEEAAAKALEDKEEESGDKPAEDEKGKEGEEESVIEYTQDDDGNLLDADGKVVAEKGKYVVNDEGEISFTGEEDKEENSLNPVIDLAKEKGFAFEDETGNPVEFDNSPEGVFKLATTIGEQMVDAYEEKLLTTYPVIEDLVTHLQAGKSPRDFFESKVSTADYKTVTLSTDDIGQQRDLVKQYLTTVAKLSPEEASDTVKLYEDAAKLEEKATVALAKLKDNQIATEKESKAANKLAIEQQRKATEAHWNSVKEVVKTGKLGNLSIPDKDKDTFFKFIAHANSEGSTGVVAKYNSLSQDKKLMIDYMLYKDLSLDELVKLQVNQEQVKKLRERRAVLKPKDGARRVIKSQTANPDDFGLGNLS